MRLISHPISWRVPIVLSCLIAFGGKTLLAQSATENKTRAGKCPVIHGIQFAETTSPTANATPDKEMSQAYNNKDWWPNQLDLSILHQNSAKSNPMGTDFDYAKAFNSLDLKAVKKDIEQLLTHSQDWWPADYGHYGPFMIRLAWHSAGTYRVGDGRGGASDGTIRFAPLNSWPDNGNLDKARRLLWPVKKKYGSKLSWADLIILTGNVSLESMGFKTFGFAGGRVDVWEPQNDIYWGPEGQWLADQRHSNGRKLENPLAASQMGLIYVNPQGPNGKPDPVAAARDIRLTFGRMAMNDEETVALIAGGHTFGKAHGAADPDEYVGPEPEAASVAEQGFGWASKYKSGKGVDTITSGLEGAWTTTPAEWSNDYFDHLFVYEWELTKSPAGAFQWKPKNGAGEGTVPDAHDDSKSHAPVMFTTDLSMIKDPAYLKISKRFHENPQEFELAFAKAWYKLTHRDMGPVSRLLGPEVAPAQKWQDPVPGVDHELVNANDVENLKSKILSAGLSNSELISTAWASASTFRGTDHRGGANGARVRLAPQKNWEVNNPAQAAKVIGELEKVRSQFNSVNNNKKISMADLIVLAGCAGVESAARQGGTEIAVPFTPGRTDATQEMTDVESFAVLEPAADGFRNYVSQRYSRPVAEMLIDRANKLTLSAPEMTVLIGGLRALNVNTGGSAHGVFTSRPGILTNDFFVNLLDMSTKWTPSKDDPNVLEGRDRNTGEIKWTASVVDLVFGSNSQLRGIAEMYACDDAKQKFANDFVAAWNKVMNLDRFDLDASAKKANASALSFR